MPVQASSVVSRRHFLGAVTTASALSARRSPKQNILFIGIDDLNDWIGCLGGHPDVKTPNLDGLAARGVLFANAHCAAPLCNPSRAAIMTGIRPSTSGIYRNSQPMRQSPVLKNAMTVSQYFMSSGYRAVGGGKIYHDLFPDPQSWHEYFPSQKEHKPGVSPHAPGSPDPAKLPANGIPQTGKFDWASLTEADTRMGDYQVVNGGRRTVQETRRTAVSRLRDLPAAPAVVRPAKVFR